ncbi:MAG: hypothetical protein HYY32_05695 [Chloroflexi bacterium]|nr:hypothetical protein [Chloroflexota bacterium]
MNSPEVSSNVAPPHQAPPPGPVVRQETLVQELRRLVAHDRLIQSGISVLVLTAALVLFVSFSGFPDQHPLIAVFIYGLLPVFFVVGAIIFILTILRN